MADLPIAVVGGGITGLAAAHRLATGGCPVVLLEASDRLGGKVRTDKVDGFVVEAGPDSFVHAKRHVADLAAGLGLGSEIIPSRPSAPGSYVFSRGALHPLPEGLLLMAPSRLLPVLRSPLLSWRGRARLLADLVIRRGSGADESLESFVTRRLGREMLDRIAQPLVAGIHASRPDTMSLAASFPRFLDMERQHRSLILAARRAARRPAAATTSYFTSFRHGMGDLVAALAGSLGGTDVRLGTAVATLTGVPGRYHLGLDGGGEVVASAVVLAVPAAVVAALLESVCRPAAEAVTTIGQVATTVATLALPAAALPPGHGFLVPSVERRAISGATYSTNKWEGRSPDPGLALVRAFLRQSSPDDAAVVAVVRAELAAIAGITASPMMSVVHRWEGGLHSYTLGHLERVAAAEAALAARHPGIRLAGAGFHGIGLNECVASGQAAAAALL